MFFYLLTVNGSFGPLWAGLFKATNSDVSKSDPLPLFPPVTHSTSEEPKCLLRTTLAAYCLRSSMLKGMFGKQSLEASLSTILPPEKYEYQLFVYFLSTVCLLFGQLFVYFLLAVCFLLSAVCLLFFTYHKQLVVHSANLQLQPI